MTPELVVTGIEHMQLQFGTNTLNGTSYDTQFYDPNNAIFNAADHSTTGKTSWDKISTVRIWLLARNSKPETAFTDTATYTMGDVVYGPMNDRFRRQVFTSVVQLRNFRN
jgi:hypothetical protein